MSHLIWKYGSKFKKTSKPWQKFYIHGNNRRCCKLIIIHLIIILYFAFGLRVEVDFHIYWRFDTLPIHLMSLLYKFHAAGNLRIPLLTHILSRKLSTGFDFRGILAELYRKPRDLDIHNLFCELPFVTAAFVNHETQNLDGFSIKNFSL